MTKTISVAAAAAILAELAGNAGLPPGGAQVEVPVTGRDLLMSEDEFRNNILRPIVASVATRMEPGRKLRPLPASATEACQHALAGITVQIIPAYDATKDEKIWLLRLHRNTQEAA